MKRILLTTAAAAMAFGVGQASAADMLSLGVGGYMENWIGYANRDDSVDGGFDIQQDAEIHFKGSLESDSGLKFSVHVELEAANEQHMDGSKAASGAAKGDDTEIDESFVRMSGEFGTIEIGQRDPIHARTHYAAGFGAGVGLNAGDTQNWVPGVYLETAGWTAIGDARTLIYITPRVNGVQVGVSYTPDSKNENSAGGAPSHNDDSAVAAGINFNHTVGDMAVKVSLGHLNVSNTGMLKYNANNSADADDNMMKGFDDKTFTNVGLSLGMGAFSFGASFATRDDGGFVPACYTGDAGSRVMAKGGCTKLPEDLAHTETDEATGIYPAVTGDGAGTGAITEVRAVEDESGQSDTWAVGITYSDGPMSVSIDHLSYERENGDERTATGLSAGYKLAPGVDWKSSIFAVEDDTKMSEGTVFVTGLDIHF